MLVRATFNLGGGQCPKPGALLDAIPSPRSQREEAMGHDPARDVATAGSDHLRARPLEASLADPSVRTDAIGTDQ